jgi:cytolysin (calcineurin-like family phosphatase)
VAAKPKPIEYFPHLLKDSATIRALEILYGNTGYSTWFKLLEILGSNAENNYEYIAKTKKECDYLLEKFKIDGKLLSNILNTLCELNAIDKELWKTQRILYVPNLKNNIQKMKQKIKINSNTNLVEKEEDIKKCDKIKYLEYVYLTEDEYKKLIAKFGKEITDDWIERVNNWVAENPKEKKRQKDSHYYTILNWHRRSEVASNLIKKPQYRDLSDYEIK